MSTPRLAFLYPAFFRSVLRSEQAALQPQTKTLALRRKQTRSIRTTRPRTAEARPNQRYGTANEPPPHLAPTARSDPLTTAIEVKDAEAAKRFTPQADEIRKETGAEAVSEQGQSQETARPDLKEYPEDQGEAAAPPPSPYASSSTTMETVLQMPSPAESAAELQQNRPPHLQAPPYVHHFDTYTMVGNLENGGFAQDQAIEIMKAMRLILAENLDVAHEGLVSKSNVENETYLFRAACSELKTEIQNNRRSEMERMRAQRAHLQHELDILTQRMTQMIQGMKDDLKGSFDDRKMNTRMEYTALQHRIKDAESKIVVTLTSDARSEVEAMRWVMTRRAALALAIAAFSGIGMLRYYTYMSRTQAEERERMAHMFNDDGRDTKSGASKGGGASGSGNAGLPAAAAASAVAQGMGAVAEEGLLVSESGGRGYVSLG